MGFAGRARQGNSGLRARLLIAGALAAAALGACQPKPPIRVVDPYADTSLPPAAAVETQPLDATGVSESPITPSGDSPITPAGGGPITPSGQAADAPMAEGDAAASDTITRVNDGGLVERLPNTCQLQNYEGLQGRDATTAAQTVTDRPVRVIAPGDIVSQEYDPRRVNLYTDGGGLVTRVICG
jgi:hypothetical protein